MNLHNFPPHIPAPGPAAMWTQGRYVVAWDGRTPLDPGDYAQHNGIWFAMSPNGLLANLGRHAVEWNEDSLTITVKPSVRVWNSEAAWHGYLEAGMWREIPEL